MSATKSLQAVLLTDDEGNVVTREDGAAITTAEGLIIMGKDGTNARYLRVDGDGILHVDIRDSEASRQAAKLVVAAYHAAALAADTDIVLVDLSDPGGDYKHLGTSSIKMTQIAGSIVKTSIGAQWRSKMGVILAIDGTAATIYWSDAATLFALDTSTVEQHKATVVPSAIDFAVAGGVLTFFAGGFVEAGVTEFNTGATLPNVEGNATTPAVGDMVLRVTQVSGGGTAEIAYAVRYLVD